MRGSGFWTKPGWGLLTPIQAATVLAGYRTPPDQPGHPGVTPDTLARSESRVVALRQGEAKVKANLFGQDR